MFFKASRNKIFSFVPRYLTLGLKREFNNTKGSLPNRTKMGLSFEYSWAGNCMQHRPEVSFGPIQGILIHVLTLGEEILEAM